jgi:hypothetical protein
MSSIRKRGGLASAVLVGGLVSAAGSPSYASVTFQNTGTVSGWTANNARGSAKISQVSSPTYKGSTALACEVNWVGVGTANHAEQMQYKAQSVGQDRYYGQVIRLPANWVFLDKNATFQQFSPENPSGPWTLNWIQKNDIRIRIQGKHHVVGKITAGVWVRVVARLKMAASGGAAQYWTNGTRTLNLTNINMAPPKGSPTIRWSVGVYATHWRNATGLQPGELAKKLIYHDHMRIATSYAEADPAGW